MNLKEAFRYQNKLQALMNGARDILSRDSNAMCEGKHLSAQKGHGRGGGRDHRRAPRRRVRRADYQVTGFLLYLLEKRELLEKCIRDAKNALPIDMDSVVGLNGKRQSIAATLKHMAALLSSAP